MIAVTAGLMIGFVVFAVVYWTGLRIIDGWDHVDSE